MRVSLLLFGYEVCILMTKSVELRDWLINAFNGEWAHIQNPAPRIDYKK